MTQIEALWQSIRREAGQNPISEGEFKLVRVDSQHPFDIYAGVGSAGSVMLAVGVSARPPAIDADTGALSYIRTQRTRGTWFMALRLVGGGLEPVFGRLCQDLIDTAVHVTTEATLVSLFRERLLLWKRLFRDGGMGRLQKFQIKGLVAELLALEAFILARPADPALSVMSWIGPSGADQDFLFSDLAVEIKAVSPGAEKVSIASAEQLCSDVPLELRVYVLRESSPSEAGAISLPVIVSRVEQLLSNRPDVLYAYRSKLMEAEYVEDDFYHTIAFTLMETKRYDVCNEFPRLVRSELPDAIADVAYSILLSSIAPFRIAESFDAT